MLLGLLIYWRSAAYARYLAPVGPERSTLAPRLVHTAGAAVVTGCASTQSGFRVTLLSGTFRRMNVGGVGVSGGFRYSPTPFPSAYASASRLLRRYASDTRAILSSWPGSSLPSPILSCAAQILGIGISRARRDGRPQASGAGGTRELLSDQSPSQDVGYPNLSGIRHEGYLCV